MTDPTTLTDEQVDLLILKGRGWHDFEITGGNIWTGLWKIEKHPRIIPRPSMVLDEAMLQEVMEKKDWILRSEDKMWFFSYLEWDGDRTHIMSHRSLPRLTANGFLTIQKKEKEKETP